MAIYHFQVKAQSPTKSGGKLLCRVHQDYVCREGDYAHKSNQQEDLVYKTSGNIPSWANNPRDFWETADALGRTNGCNYREFILGLQEEFTLEENIALVEDFLKESGIKDNHAYTYGIHDKTATFNKDHRNIHVHIMFNEKIIEKDRPLAAEKFFKRYAQNKLTGEPTQGYKNSNAYDNYHRENLQKMRAKWAELNNAKFKEKGLDIRISEKSLKEQRQEALREGDYTKAKELNRTPAPYMGNLYRNPKTMEQIQSQIKKYEQAAETSETTQTIDLSKLSFREQKIILFAQDAVLRKINQELQVQLLAEKIALDIKNAPVKVKVTELKLYLSQQLINIAAEKDKKLSAYQNLRKMIPTPEVIKVQAANNITNGLYGSCLKECAKTSQALQADNTNPILLKAHKKAQFALSNQEMLLRGYLSKKYEAEINRLNLKNESQLKQLSKLYADYKVAARKKESYNKVLAKLESYPDKTSLQLTGSAKSKQNRKHNLTASPYLKKLAEKQPVVQNAKSGTAAITKIANRLLANAEKEVNMQGRWDGKDQDETRNEVERIAKELDKGLER